MSGVIVGGWEYVWAAYGITAGAFLLYGLNLVNRLKESSSEFLGSSGFLPEGSLRSEESRNPRNPTP